MIGLRLCTLHRLGNPSSPDGQAGAAARQKPFSHDFFFAVAHVCINYTVFRAAIWRDGGRELAPPEYIDASNLGFIKRALDGYVILYLCRRQIFDERCARVPPGRGYFSLQNGS